MSEPSNEERAITRLTRNWNIYEDDLDALDDLEDIGIMEEEARPFIESYKKSNKTKSTPGISTFEPTDDMGNQVLMSASIYGVTLKCERDDWTKKFSNVYDIDVIYKAAEEHTAKEHKEPWQEGTFPYISGVTLQQLLEEEDPRDPATIEPDKKAKEPPESKGGNPKEKFKFKQDDIIVILGKRGSGKTNLIRFLVGTLKNNHFVVLDALGNLVSLENMSNVNYVRVNPADKAAVDEPVRATLDEGNSMLVIDEIDRYKTGIGTALNDAFNLGRNFGVGALVAARRTARIDKDILAGATWVFVFKHILPQDLEVLVDWFAYPEETFRDLASHEVILFHEDEEVWRGTVPMVGSDESATPLPSKEKNKSKEPEKEPEEGEKEREVSKVSKEPTDKEPEENDDSDKNDSEKSEEEIDVEISKLEASYKPPNENYVKPSKPNPTGQPTDYSYQVPYGLRQHIPTSSIQDPDALTEESGIPFLNEEDQAKCPTCNTTLRPSRSNPNEGRCDICGKTYPISGDQKYPRVYSEEEESYDSAFVKIKDLLDKAAIEVTKQGYVRPETQTYVDKALRELDMISKEKNLTDEDWEMMNLLTDLALKVTQPTEEGVWLAEETPSGNIPNQWPSNIQYEFPDYSDLQKEVWRDEDGQHTQTVPTPTYGEETSKFECPYDSESFKTEEELEEHIWEHEPSVSPLKVDQEPRLDPQHDSDNSQMANNIPYVCPKEGESFHDEDEFYGHLKKHDDLTTEELSSIRKSI